MSALDQVVARAERLAADGEISADDAERMIAGAHRLAAREAPSRLSGLAKYLTAVTRRTTMTA